MSDKNYDNELKGALWHESISQVIKRGNVTVDGQKKYWVLIKSENDKGDTKYELAFSAGLVFPKTAEEKLKPTSPDVNGKITYNETVYNFGGWQNTTDSGLDYYSCSLKADTEESEEEAPF